MRNPRTALGLTLLVAIVVVGALCMHPQSTKCEPPAALVPPECLPSLVMGPADMVGDVVLSSVAVVSGGPSTQPDSTKTTAGYEETWNGDMTTRGGRQVSGRTVIIAACILPSVAQAVEYATQAVRNTSLALPEQTGQGDTALFADRAWGTGGRLVFTRANVVGDVFISTLPKEKIDDVHKLAKAIARRVDAALAGRPESVALLPLSAQELGMNLAEAFAARDIGEKLWGKEATTIALTDAHGIPRSIPARKLPGDDYLVPLRHVAGVINRYNELRASKDGNEVTLDIGQGKIRFKKGESRAAKAGESFDLGRPVESAEGELLVPVSVAEKLTGKRLVWEKRGALSIARLEAPPPKP